MTSSIQERKLISKIRRDAKKTAEDLVRGIGDDCSVFGKPDQQPWLISTDMLVDRVHFSRDWHSPHLLGRKCIAVNLSDIAAMGGEPRFILISACLSTDITDEWVSLWYQGVLEIIAEHNCLLIGGDTVSGKELSFSITVLGTPSCGPPIYRDGAKEGDIVFVSGMLGNAAMGLEISRNPDGESIGRDSADFQAFLDAHLNPEPQVTLGLMLSKSGLVSSMQDISDGLATDLGHICKESNVQARLLEKNLPSLPALEEECEKYNLKMVDVLLRGGEDYQLVFTVRKDGIEEFDELSKTWTGFSLHKIGVITRGAGVLLESTSGEIIEVSFTGYEHRS